MKTKLPSKANEFKIKFGGRPNEINIHTLLTSLANISSIIDELSQEVGEGQKVEIKIKALEKGSFLVHIGLSPADVINILSIIDWDTVYKIVGSFVGIITLRKLLKGEKPKEVKEKGDKISVKTKSGSTVIVDKPTFNIYTDNVPINEAISKTFETLKADSNVTSFEVTDKKDKTIIKVDDKEFEEMSTYSQMEIPEAKTKVVNELAILHTYKMVWDKDRKWEFYYRGNKISAKITDEQFFKRIDKGEQFAKGDTLEAEIQIFQEFDATVNTFKNTEYQVVKIIRHIPRPEQGKLEL